MWLKPSGGGGYSLACKNNSESVKSAQKKSPTASFIPVFSKHSVNYVYGPKHEFQISAASQHWFCNVNFMKQTETGDKGSWTSGLPLQERLLGRSTQDEMVMTKVLKTVDHQGVTP